MTTPDTDSLDDTLARLARIAPDDYYSLWDIQAHWSRLIAADVSVLRALHARYLDTLRHCLGQPAQGDACTGVMAYQFVQAFSARRYLPMGGTARALAWQLLQESHAEHLDLLRQALAREDIVLTPVHTRLNTGRWGDVPQAMLSLYVHHAPYGEAGAAILTDAAREVSAFYHAFPRQPGYTVADLLAHHEDMVGQVAGLMRFYLLEHADVQEGVLADLALSVLGHHADRQDARHAQAGRILSQVLADVSGWPDEAVTRFVERLVCYPLGMDTYTQAAAVARQRQMIAVQQRILRDNRYAPRLGMSADSQRERDAQYLAKYEAELKVIEQDFSAWQARRRRKAVQRIAVSSLTRQALTTVARALPAAHRATVQGLLDEAADHASRPKQFPIGRASDNRFKDLGLKLLVIEELMYRQQVLTPRFDVRAFAEEYEAREIDVEAAGYAVIPEVERYFRYLPIPDELLARVVSLHQSSGLDGGPAFIQHLFPFWDPGAGDEPIPVTAKAVDDLALLPNLRCISGLEHSKPAPRLRKALAARGIVCVDEASAG